jgi:hypothetical protein
MGDLGMGEAKLRGIAAQLKFANDHGDHGDHVAALLIEKQELLREYPELDEDPPRVVGRNTWRGGAEKRRPSLAAVG